MLSTGRLTDQTHTAERGHQSFALGAWSPICTTFPDEPWLTEPYVRAPVLSTDTRGAAVVGQGSGG